MISKVALDRLYIVVSLSVHVDLDAAEIKVLKVVWITIICTVKCGIVNHPDHDPARDLARKEPLMYIISHSRSHAVAFAHDTSDWILGISNLKSFSLRNKYSGGYVRFANQQFTLVNLDSK